MFDDDQVLEEIRLFKEMARRFSLNDGTPTFKFLHPSHRTLHTSSTINAPCANDARTVTPRRAACS